jgi:hypothetical protein
LSQKRSQDPACKIIKNHAAQNVPEHIREMVTKWVFAPEKVVEDVRNRLDGSVMSRISVRKKIVPERLQNESWALN